jgi:histidinol-phosphate aminotransferase
MSELVDRLLRPGVAGMAPYAPIVPFEVLSEQLGLPIEAITKLDANENPYGSSERVREALANMPFAHVYPDPESRDLRSGLARYTGLPMDNLLAGAGADELIDLIMRLFIVPEDAIVNCPPTFGMYAFDAQINGARLVNVWRRDDFSLDVDSIVRAVRDDGAVKLLFVTSPNNPDGGMISRAELDRLLDMPVVVVLDEAYIEFAGLEHSSIHMVPKADNLVVLRTFSKWAGLAGLRLGYGAFPLPMMQHLWKIKQPYNVSVAAQFAGLASLADLDTLQTNVKKVIRERLRLFRGLTEVPFLAPFPSQANFILCRVVGISAKELKQRLAADGILARHYDSPGLSDYIRFSVGLPEHTDILLSALWRLEVSNG